MSSRWTSFETLPSSRLASTSGAAASSASRATSGGAHQRDGSSSARHPTTSETTGGDAGNRSSRASSETCVDQLEDALQPSDVRMRGDRSTNRILDRRLGAARRPFVHDESEAGAQGLGLFTRRNQRGELVLQSRDRPFELHDGRVHHRARRPAARATFQLDDPSRSDIVGDGIEQPNHLACRDPPALVARSHRMGARLHQPLGHRGRNHHLSPCIKRLRTLRVVGSRNNFWKFISAASSAHRGGRAASRRARGGDFRERGRAAS